MPTRKTEKTITFLLWTSIAISIYLYNKFDVKFLFGIISLSLVSIFLFTKKYDFSLIVLFFALLLSSFDIVLFSVAFGFHIGIVSIVPLFLLIALTFSRRRELLDLKDKWFDVDEIEISKSQEYKIAMFKREFQNLSTEELVNKLENIKLVNEAKIAIDLILRERDMTNKFTI